LCPAETQVTINNSNPDLTVTYSTTDATCNGADGSIKITPPVAPNVGGGGPYTYALYNGVTTSAFQNSTDFNNLNGGTYNILVKDATGCTKTVKNVAVNFPGFVNYSAPIVTPPDCAANGKNGMITFKIIDTGSFKVALSQDPSAEPADSVYKNYINPSTIFTNLSNGIYYVYIKSASAECATRSSSITINGAAAISFNLNPICQDNKVSLQLTNITGETGTPYELTVRDRLDAVIVDKPFTVDPLSLSYLLNADDFPFLQTPGEYKLQLQQIQVSTFCQIISDVVKYDVYPQLFAAVQNPTRKSYPDIPSGEFKIINVIGGLPQYTIDVTLDSAASGLQYIPTSRTVTRNTNFQYEAEYKNVPPGRYRVDITDSLGCTIELFARVPLDLSIFIPNIFTPNEDGYNDTFTIRNLPEGTKMVVTNRWGKEVFASKAYQNDWDGSGVSDGIYFYRLEVPAGSPLTGWVEIVRGEKP